MKAKSGTKPQNKRGPIATYEALANVLAAHKKALAGATRSRAQTSKGRNPHAAKSHEVIEDENG